MAIGSAPEIGVKFVVGDKSFDWALWREMVGDDGLGGYAILCYPDPVRMARINQEWEDALLHVPVQ